MGPPPNTRITATSARPFFELVDRIGAERGRTVVDLSEASLWRH